MELKPLLARGTTADGVDMLIAIYGSNFYLWDPVNSQVILLNTGSSNVYQGAPGATGYQKFWSYETWLGGIGTDVMYFADGVDATTKWQMCLEYPAMAALSTDKQLLVPYPNRLILTGGTIIAMLAGVPTKFSYSAVDPVLSITPNGSVSSFSLTSSNATQLVASPTTGVTALSLHVNP